MKTQNVQKRKNSTKTDPLVICRTEEGFRVYAASDPTRSYVVSGSSEAPSCTCPDFQHHEGNAEWYCKHILAVLNQVRGQSAHPCDSDNDELEEQLAIQQEGSLSEEETNEPETSDRPTHMFIKRSVSPDGRIDSLSVEFSCPVEKLPVKEIKSKAVTTLRIQSEIVASFLEQNGNGNSHPTVQKQDGDGTASATMLSIAGQDGKWGRRLYLSLRSNGYVLKLFGSRKQLQERLTAAGFTKLADELYEGMQLNVPCRIVTQPSEDGRWLNVEQILPANPSSGARSVRR
jgi:hypothetical protein